MAVKGKCRAVVKVTGMFRAITKGQRKNGKKGLKKTTTEL